MTEIQDNTITFTGTNNIISDTQGISLSKGIDFFKNKVYMVPINSGILDIDLSLSRIFHVIANENINTLQFSNFSSYKSGYIVIKNTNTLNHSTTFPTNVVWQHNTAQVLSGINGAFIVLEYKTSDVDIMMHYMSTY